MATEPGVFFSYARNDGLRFVKPLYNDLMRRG